MPRRPPPPPETIAVNFEYMKARRKELGFNQMETAQLAGLSSGQYYSALERGVVPNVMVDTLRRLAWALNCPIDKLVRPFEGKKPEKIDRSKPLLTNNFRWDPTKSE